MALPDNGFRTLHWFVILALVAGCGSDPDQPAPQSRPNILLVISDDQGWGEFGFRGHPYLKTPVLDEMAANSLRLERFYAAAPSCSPTRASVLTGRHPNRSGTFAPNWSIRPEEITLAQILRDAGYRTAHFGKWHLGPVKHTSPVNPARMGFDEYVSHDNFFGNDPALSRNGGPPEVFQGECSAVVASEAIKYIQRTVETGEPFFVAVWFANPHGPYVATDEDLAKYQNVEDEVTRHRYGEITAMDRAVGQLRDALRELDAAHNTIVWFHSDNGLADPHGRDWYNGGLRGSKGDLTEGGVLVSAIIEWPAVITRPRVSYAPSVTSDILPTVLDLLHLESPDPSRPMDGVSLGPEIVGQSLDGRPPIGFWRYHGSRERENEPWLDPELARGTTPTPANPAIEFRNHRHPVALEPPYWGDAAWVDGRHKLIINREGNDAELYDVVADPGEQNNIAAEHGERVANMRRALDEWRRSVERSLTGADYGD